MSDAIGYARVSTEEQGASGLGLEAQESAIRAAAARLGLTVGAIHRDAGLSGAAPVERRPGLLSALADVRRGAVLLVAKRDRLGRDPIVVAMIERLMGRKGGRVVSAAGEGTDGDGPTDVLMRRVVDAFAEYERLLIGARTKAALGAKRARGEKTGGGVPFGFRLQGGRLVEEPAERSAAARMVEMRTGGASLRTIAAEMNARRITTKQGRCWKAPQVASALRVYRSRVSLETTP